MSASELIQSEEEIACHPSFDRLQFAISDYTAVEGHDLHAGVVERLAVIRFGSMATNPDLRLIVVSGDSSILALLDPMKQPLLLGSNETLQFPTMELATTWTSRQPARYTIRPRR